MSDSSLWISIGSFIAAILSACFAYWAALETKSARKIARSDFLKPYFDEAAYLWEPIFGKIGRDEKQIGKGKNGAESLKILLGEMDDELKEALDWMLITIDKVPNGFLEYYSQKEGNPPSYQTPENATALNEQFERKRLQYLCIG
ncbi:MAG: hypothetical protein PHD48_09940 [Alphaproteobacteria bacterium]|nr:hypothetical protein [Alphaproteobacteria bacterium]